MKKKIFAGLLVFVLFSAAGISYLNRVFLPGKLKALLITGLQDATGKRAAVDSLRFNIFKGFVVTGVRLYDGPETLVSLREASCRVVIPNLFKRQIVIPTFTARSLDVFVQRDASGRFNLQEIFRPRPAAGKKAPFTLIAAGARLIDGRIRFRDESVAPAVSVDIEHLNVRMNVSLPDRVKFHFQGEIPGSPRGKITGSGEYVIPVRELIADLAARDLPVLMVSPYISVSGVKAGGGTLDVSCRLSMRGPELMVKAGARIKGCVVRREELSGSFNSDIQADLRYTIGRKVGGFSGTALFTDSALSGIPSIGRLDGIGGEVTFDNSGLSTRELRASLWGIPFQARGQLHDFLSPALNITVTSTFDLAAARQIAREKFNITVPVSVTGQGDLLCSLDTVVPLKQVPPVDVTLDLSGARVVFEKSNTTFGDVSGRLLFNGEQAQWKGLQFTYAGTGYTSDGAVTDFTSPGIRGAVSSKDSSVEFAAALNLPAIRVSKLAGGYLNSTFSVTGDIDTSDPAAAAAAFKGKISVELNDLQSVFPQMQKPFERIKPAGIAAVDFSANGKGSDIRNWTVSAAVESPALSAYGLRAQDVRMAYQQESGVARVPELNMSLYEGNVTAQAWANLAAQGVPYWFSVDGREIKLEKLKIDTAAKDQDLAGSLSLTAAINGRQDSLDAMTGAGEVFIRDGNLWQLNLFKGIGSLLLAKDFARIVFTEGRCSFLIKEKAVVSEDIKLQSELTNLSGKLKVGFDRSLDGEVNVEILDELVPLEGSLKDVTTAILGEAGRFGIIVIGGTLDDPKPKFKPAAAVSDFFKGLSNILLGK